MMHDLRQMLAEAGPLDSEAERRFLLSLIANVEEAIVATQAIADELRAQQHNAYQLRNAAYGRLAEHDDHQHH